MTFEKYNANPENKNIGVCSIRAICTATPLTYQQAKKLLETKVFEIPPGNALVTIAETPPRAAYTGDWPPRY